MKEINLSLKTSVIIAAVLIFCCLAYFPLPWNETVNNAAIDLQFKLRGGRELSDKIVVVFIGPEDVQSLGWPLTRDYYGYMTHILKESDAKTIAFGILFDTEDTRYPEFDASLADFFQAAQNVCLPFTFTRLRKISDGFFEGENPVLPIKKFRTNAAATGFSTLPDESIIRKLPLIVNQGDSIKFSFGFEMARLYSGGFANSVNVHQNRIEFLTPDGKKSIPVDRSGSIRLNHFGTTQNLTAVSFVDLIQRFREEPDSIDFSSKLVLVAVTSPGISPQKITPLSPAVPAIFLHATVAENLLEGNYLQDSPKILEIVIIIILIGFLPIIWTYQRKQMRMYSAIGLLLCYWLLTHLIFRAENVVLPLFYPTVSYLVLAGFLIFVQSRKKLKQQFLEKSLLKREISKKQEQLKQAEKNLAKTGQKLKEERQNKEEVSTELKRLLDQRKNQVIEFEKQLRDLQAYQTAEIEPETEFPDIIHSEDSRLVDVIKLITKIGSDDISVLISGETGTGKEMIARAIHQTGNRKSKPFIAVNCGALPETLLESELFGHERGSFTGAAAQRKGRFELADGGTLFLDEITETSQAFQAKLLRVLQEGTFERLGGEKTIRVDVRIIAASSKDLKSEVDLGRFREDLFYRLNGFPVTLPPLRERKSDIPLLVNHFLKKHNFQTLDGFSEQAMSILSRYRWPGNVRELENVVRRSAILAQSGGRKLIQIQDIPEELAAEEVQKLQTSYPALDEQILSILRSLRFSHASISQTARALGGKDRGTITEYFRGICFEQLVAANFDIQAAARLIANSSEEEIVDRVTGKIENYLKNVQQTIAKKSTTNLDPLFKGLPQKYHPFLKKIIEFYRDSSRSS